MSQQLDEILILSAIPSLPRSTDNLKVPGAVGNNKYGVPVLKKKKLGLWQEHEDCIRAAGAEESAMLCVWEDT